MLPSTPFSLLSPSPSLLISVPTSPSFPLPPPSLPPPSSLLPCPFPLHHSSSLSISPFSLNPSVPASLSPSPYIIPPLSISPFSLSPGLHHFFNFNINFKKLVIFEEKIFPRTKSNVFLKFFYIIFTWFS